MRKLNIGIIKNFLAMVLMLSGIYMMRGQNSSEIKDKMTEIKLNEDFIFGEGMHDDKDIAYGMALDDLLIFANELKERNSQEKITVSDLVTKVEYLVYENGNRYEVLVYIPFQTVMETQRKETAAKSGITVSSPGVTETVDEEPEAEEPVIDEPVIDEPELKIAETPEAAEEAIAVEEAPAEEESPIIEETPVEEEDQAVEETPVVEEDVVKETTDGNSIAEQNEVEDFLLTQDNFAEIKSFLSEMKRSGKIKETGAADSITALPRDASLILIDELGGILAYLSPEGAQGRINYRNHKSDSENNYNSKFIVWYRK